MAEKEKQPFEPTPDTTEWVHWKLHDDSWQQWRDEHPDEVAALQKEITIRDLLAEKHTGMRISASGILGRIRDGRYFKELNFGCGQLLCHLEQMANRFYAGDVKAVDEFLQLYDLDDERPNNVEPPNA
jgi:hypothetical protein